MLVVVMLWPACAAGALLRMSGDTQQLPSKDMAVFKSIVKFYESKQYKKGAAWACAGSVVART